MSAAAGPPVGVAVVVAVVVATDERHWLGECLATLTASVTGPQVRLDVVVVDNASTDGGPDLVAEGFPDVELVRSPVNLGFAGATNVGLRRALARHADHVLMLNPDTRTPPGLIAGLVDFMRRWPEYGIVGPLQYEYEQAGTRWPGERLNAWSRDALAAGEDHALALDWPGRAPHASPAAGRAPATLEHAYVQGAALFCRTAVLREVGLLDPEYHTYYEETDLCRRARWARWRVALVLDLGVQHAGGGGAPPSRYRRRHMQRNKYYFLLSDPEWSVADALRLCARWVRSDLAGRGAVPTTSRREAVAETVAGLAWLATRLPAVAGRRRAHRSLRGRARSGRP